MIAIKETQLLLQMRIPFNGGNFTANFEVGSEGGEYVVRSYGVEVARWLPMFGGECWVTDKKYSQTTSRHTNLVKKAWGLV